MLYVLRWTTRATPFGRLAGVTPLDFGARGAVRWGDDHHGVGSREAAP
ncbi:lantibiotic dehydratase [Catellatospora sp. NPDC049111]